MIFNLSFVLLSAKIDPSLKKQGYKKNLLIAYVFGYIKISFVLIIKIIVFYM